MNLTRDRISQKTGAALASLDAEVYSPNCDAPDPDTKIAAPRNIDHGKIDHGRRRIQHRREADFRRRPRMLFLTDVCPLPLDCGQRVRVSNLLAGCAQVFDVTLLCPAAASAADKETLEGICADVQWIEAVDNRGAAGPRSLLSIARAVPGVWRPKTLARYAPFVRALKRIDPSAFELVWAERPHIARLCGSLRAQTILDLDDLEHRRIQQAARLTTLRSTWSKGPVGLYRYLLYRQLELRSSRSFLASVVCSAEDRVYLRDQGCENVIVVPNSTATIAARSYQHRADGPLRLVFLGNISHPPNRDGLIYFIEKILPLLRKGDPQLRFDVIGACDATLSARYATQAEFRGFVPELASALSQYDVFVAPIRYGSGTRVKLLDAMASQIPIVTTRAGAEGCRSCMERMHCLRRRRRISWKTYWR